MTHFHLHPFLVSLETDGIRPTMRDYERMSLVLQTGGPWRIDHLRDVLSALLAKDEARQDLFVRRFDAFFRPNREATITEVEIQHVLANLKLLAQRPVQTRKPGTKRRGRIQRKQAEKGAGVASRRMMWFLPLVALVLLIWIIKTVFSPPLPILSLTSKETDFGEQILDQTQSTDIPLNNTGTGPLEIKEIQISPQDMSFALSPPFFPTTVKPGEPFTIKVLFTPRVQRTFQAQLTLVSNDPAGPHRIALKGKGIPPPDPDLSKIPEGKSIFANIPYIENIQTLPLVDPVNPPLIFTLCGGIAVFMLVIVVAYGIWLWRVRIIPEDIPPVWDENGDRLYSLGNIGGKTEPVMDGVSLDRIADSLGYFQSREPGKALNICASIDASIQNGGIPVLAFQRGKQIRSLLILEDRFAEAVEWNPIAAELAEGLRRRAIPVVYGRFKGSPDIFRSDDGSVHRLEDLEDRRRGFLVLIFTDGKWTWGPKKAFVLEWLSRWPMLAWMELREHRFWDQTSAVPVRYKIPIYPATPSGTVRAVRRFVTEMGAPNDFSENAENPKELPTFTGEKIDGPVERLLGDALTWAQDCAMFQPVSPGLAHALRRQFHEHLPPARIERLYALPGSVRNAAGLRFSKDIQKVLRKGFINRRDESEQQAVLEFILQEIQKTEPEKPGSPAHMAWEIRKERVRMELGSTDRLERFAELCNTPLGDVMRADLAPFGFREEPHKIPLRIRKPKNRHELQRLARINASFGIKELEKYPIGRGHRIAMAAFVFFFFAFSAGAIFNYKDMSLSRNLKIIGLDAVSARLEIEKSGKWQPVVSGNAEALTKNPLSHGEKYRIVLPGGHDRSRKEFRASKDRLTQVYVETQKQEREWIEPLTGIPFVKIPKGCFQMGSPKDEKGQFSNEGPVHEVCFKEAQWLGKHEVTNKQYRKFKADHNSKDYKGRTLNDDDQPVVLVSWEDAKAFIRWLNQKYNGKHEFRLPSEAEWEYACRAGTPTARFWGEKPDDACKFANVNDITSKEVNKFDWDHHNCDDGYAVASPVGRLQPNNFGLYDMLGNVWEWCEDEYSGDIYKQRAMKEDPIYDPPIYAGGGPLRVVRGGGWGSGPGDVRCADRNFRLSDNRYDNLGFRLARTK